MLDELAVVGDDSAVAVHGEAVSRERRLQRSAPKEELVSFVRGVLDRERYKNRSPNR